VEDISISNVAKNSVRGIGEDRTRHLHAANS
jgi:hypothetical protein